MSCQLTFIGENLDVDALVERIDLPGFEKKYKGELFSPRRNLYSKTSSASIFISDTSIGDTDFENFKQQAIEAQNFLQTHKDKLKCFADIEGVDYATISFGSNSTSLIEKSVQSFYFPISLITICAELKISIETTIYNNNHFL